MIVEQSLPLTHHAQYVIVNNDLNKRQVISCCRSNFVHVHTEASVACDIDYHFVRTTEFCTDCCSKTITHGSQSAGSDQSTRFFVFVILGSPHLVLSHIGNDDRITFCHTIQFFDDIRSGQTFLVIFQRIFCFHIFHFFHPGIVILRMDLFV